MSPTKKDKKPKKVTINSDLLVQLNPPEIFFSVQQAFQELGCHFIELSTGKVIQGQVLIADLGIVKNHPTHPLRTKPPLGFLKNTPPPQNKIPDLYADNIDALFSFYDPVDDGITSDIVIKVVNHHDLQTWHDISLRVASQFVITNNNVITPLININLISLCIPGESNPKSVLKIIQNQIRQARTPNTNLTDAVSDGYLDIEPDDYDSE